jgi:L-carnitine/gamma-butyrobetaine antiporter
MTSYALYVGIGVVFAYFFFVEKKEVFRPSTACEAFLGSYAQGYYGKAIDVFYMVGIIAGVSTSVGLGTPLLSEVITKISGIPHTLSLDATILVIWTVIFAVCVYGGLEKGIKQASNIRVWLGFGLLAYVLVVGPTAFMFNNFFDGLGTMLTNFFRMSLYTDPIQNSGFPQGWTIFYFAWFIAFALSTGIYLARISRGRTVREFTLGATFSGVACVYTYFMIFGSYGLDLYNRKALNIGDIVAANGTPRAIVEVFATLPFSSVVLPIILVLLFISTANVINSVAYTLAIVSTEKLRAGEEPAKWNRVFWALVLGGLSLTLIFLGGMKPLQVAAIAGSFPTMIIMGLILIGFLKKAGKTWGNSIEEIADLPINRASMEGQERQKNLNG